MREQLERRLAALRQEFETGQRMLADLDAQQSRLRETLLRIAGGIQVLEEELAGTPDAEPVVVNGHGTPPTPQQ